MTVRGRFMDVEVSTCRANHAKSLFSCICRAVGLANMRLLDQAARLKVARSTRRSWLLLFAALAVVKPTLANGRFPSASQLIAHPRDPARLVLRTTYGLLFSKDAGAHWDWVCERAVGYGGIEDPSLAVTSNGTVLAGLFAGLSTSLDEGCTWERDDGLPAVVVDLALRVSPEGPPGTLDRVYAITGKYAGKGDSGSLFQSELFVSTHSAETADGGGTWSRRASLDPTLLLESVEVAPSDPKRVYLTAVRGDTMRKGYLLVSNDDGRNWLERPIPLESSERAPFIAGVDPTRSDRVYLRTSGPEKNRLLVTEDAGKTVRTLFAGGPLLGFALSERGDRVYVGGLTDGLRVASVPEYHFEQRWAMPVQCLAVIGSALWACSAPRAGFELGISTDDGASFEPRLTLTGMRGPLSCASPTSSMSKCSVEWDKLQADFGAPRASSPSEPPGAPDAATAAGTPAPTVSSRCGCRVPGARGEGLGGLAALCTFLGCTARRRPRTRAPRGRA
jgi:photosystem II stability/assembly factor-like uncharacterized protein